MTLTVEWKPTATRSMLARRSALLTRSRHFFLQRGLLEVDTPIVVNAPVTDVHIHSAKVQFADESRPFFLHTSPEYAMKRLLAAGSGDIFQICHVVRGLERGRVHNAEFTLIEWYRVGYSLEQLMEEVETLVRTLLSDFAVSLASQRLSYQEAFVRGLGLDPFTASMDELAGAAGAVGFVASNQAGWEAGGPAGLEGRSQSGREAQRDELLELLMGAVIGPALGQSSLTFVYDYPASQAALARVNPDDPRTALRFELYCKGLELANGFQELASAQEQRARFSQDNAERRRRGLPAYELDERLLAALQAGMPECAGVALGFDRTLMLATGAEHIDAVLPFPTDVA